MPKKERGVYLRIGDRWKKGDRSMLAMPFDMLLLEALQPPNANVGGLYQLGATIPELAQKFPPVTANQVNGRMKMLEAIGLTQSVQMVGGRGSVAWQRTEEGEEELKRWQQSQKSET